ncbi:MAG: cache domain-containing protein, partial [Anaerolineae bacterium]|nr:cache domain-containing protein [Anaerolineae bacterium]
MTMQQRRSVNIITGVMLAIVLAILLYGAAFVQTGLWQTAGTVALCVGALVAYGYARRLALQGRLRGAAYLALLSFLIASPLNTLVIAGLAVPLTVTVLLVGAMYVGALFPAADRRIAAACVIASAAALVLLDTLAANLNLPRLNLLDMDLLTASIPLVMGGAVVIVLWQLFLTYRRSASVQFRLISAFLLVTLIPLLISSISLGLLNWTGEQNQVQKRLETIALFEQRQIDTWSSTLTADLRNFRSTYELTIQQALGQGSSLENIIRQSRVDLRTELRRLSSVGQRFREVLLIDPAGLVVVAGGRVLEGRRLADEAFFQPALARQKLIPFYESPAFGLTPVFVEAIADGNGTTIGLLVGLPLTATLTGILDEREGLGATGESYLVSADLRLLTA